MIIFHPPYREDQVNEEIKTYWCYGCGFMSNTLMKECQDFLDKQTQVLPELYKDLIYEDEDGKKWIPSSVNKPKQGMVFANGSTSQNWKWAAVKAIEVTEDEKDKYPIPNKKGKYYEEINIIYHHL